MSLKLNINADDHAKLDDAIKALYVADGDNFKLTVDGLEDTGALKRAKDREALAAKEAKERADTLQAELDEIRAREAEGDKDTKRKKGDIEALEKSWKDEKDKAVKAATDKTAIRERQLQELLVDSKADALAHELFTVPEIGKDYIRKFLRAELDGDVPTTRILDNMGQPTAKSLDDFKKEMLDNVALKGILVASNASGGGAGNGGGSGAGGSTKKLADMSDAERIELYKTNPTVFNQLVEQQRTQ